MSVPRTVGVAVLITIFLYSQAALAQRPGEMTLFSNPSYSGSRYTVTGARENIALSWTVSSIQITPGARWETCTRTRYRGVCTTISSSVANVRRTVFSARPVSAVTLPAPLPPAGGAAGPSLRGISAEFFRTPSSNGNRVISCPSGASVCAAASADRFCRSRGWTASSYQTQETVGDRRYLADVLCTRWGN